MHVPSLQVIAGKVMKFPTSFGAGERSFFNARHIQNQLRTRFSQHCLQQLLYVYYNSRALAHIPLLRSTHAAAPTLPAPVSADETAGDEKVGSDGNECMALMAASAALGDIDDGKDSVGDARGPLWSGLAVVTGGGGGPAKASEVGGLHVLPRVCGLKLVSLASSVSIRLAPPVLDNRG